MCHGRYALEAGREAFSKPVWKHASRDRWIAMSDTGYWTIMEEEWVGVAGGGGATAFLQLVDKDSEFPADSEEPWQEFQTGTNAWKKVATAKMAADPPPKSYKLSGSLNHQSECLGEYVLVAEREAFYRPLWKVGRLPSCTCRATEQLCPLSMPVPSFHACALSLCLCPLFLPVPSLCMCHLSLLVPCLLLCRTVLTLPSLPSLRTLAWCSTPGATVGSPRPS